MKWLLDLSTRGKLSLAFGSMVALFAIAVITAYTGLTSIQESQKNLYEEEFSNVLDLLTLRANHNAVRAASLEMMSLPKGTEQEARHQDIKLREKENDEIAPRLLERSRDDPGLVRKLQDLEAIRNLFARTREKELIPLIYEGKIQEARKIALGVQDERNEKMRAIARDLVNEARKRAQSAVALSEQEANQAVRVFVVISLLALVLAAAMVIFLNRIIATPLREVAGVAERAASGDLTVAVSSDNRADEVGQLTQTFQRMVETLRQVNREIREGVNVLGSSASEILAATTQVASGAAETATAVSETTTTVEEVKQTAQVASQKAKYVSEGAQKTVQVSQAGKKAVEDTIEVTNRIREQMESIAENVVKLSEQSQAIGEIIATVNDLADQSNLLAVNAAIEAAKAGEQGKGFAVVAQEVKNLAEQSKQATAQVRAILGDIQRATSAAVMATEQGTKAVEAGVRQSTEAGEAIRALAAGIAEAAQAATQIAASSQQQSAGMDQVASAMENIKEASAQNVASTKQAESAAQNLHELGAKLKQLVEQYRV